MPTTATRTIAQSVFCARLPNDSVAQPKTAVGVRRATAATTDSGIDCVPVGARVTRQSRSRNNTNNAARAPVRPSDAARFETEREDDASVDIGLFSGREKLRISANSQECGRQWYARIAFACLYPLYGSMKSMDHYTAGRESEVGIRRLDG